MTGVVVHESATSFLHRWQRIHTGPCTTYSVSNVCGVLLSDTWAVFDGFLAAQAEENPDGTLAQATSELAITDSVSTPLPPAPAPTPTSSTSATPVAQAQLLFTGENISLVDISAAAACAEDTVGKGVKGAEEDEKDCASEIVVESVGAVD